MIWVGKGKVVVATSGTPVVLSVNQFKMSAIMFTYDPADGSSAVITIKDRNGNAMAPISPTGSTQPLLFAGNSQNSLDMRDFQVDSSANGKGPYVAYAID